MNRTTLILLSAAALAALGCSADPNAKLDGENANAPAADSAYYHHDNEGIVEPGALHADTPSGPVAQARLHGCAKITYAALGSILKTRGATATGTQNAQTLYAKGGPALGVANYGGRVPEAIIASTSALAKEFDIFAAAAPEVQTNAGQQPACQGVTIADGTGKFSKDGISCLMGTLATDTHVAVANQAVADAVKGGATQTQGIQLAIAAIMQAAHTCE